MTDEDVTVVTYPNAALNFCLYLPDLQQLKKGQKLMVVGFEGLYLDYLRQNKKDNGF